MSQAISPQFESRRGPFTLRGRFELPDRCPSCGCPISKGNFPNHIRKTTECRLAFGGDP